MQNHNQKLMPIAYIKDIEGQNRLIIRYIETTKNDWHRFAAIYNLFSQKYTFLMDAHTNTEEHEKNRKSEFIVLTACNELYDKKIKNNPNDSDFKSFDDQVNKKLNNHQKTENKNQERLKNIIILETAQALLEEKQMTQPRKDLIKHDKTIEVSSDLSIPNNGIFHICDWQQKSENRTENYVEICTQF